MSTVTTIGSASASVANAAEVLQSRVGSETVIRTLEPLARRTTLRVGGPADLYVEPANEADLAAVLSFSAAHQLEFLVLGRGSNLLVRDGGYRGVVIHLSQPAFSRIERIGMELRCGAGARLKAVAFEAKRAGMSGLEFLEGIPGTVGGGLRMNAGAMGGAMFEIVSAVRVMHRDGRIQECLPSELGVAYRRCEALKGAIGLSALLRGQPGNPEEIEKRLNEYSRKRWSSQPAAPSAGCMFKNPPSIPAGRLIEELGLKGTRIGGAIVSQEHGNFLVNDGTATARNVLDLIELVRGRAREKRGIELETEVEIVGEN